MSISFNIIYVKEIKMKLLLNGYKVEIDTMCAYQTYRGLLCGIIDTERNDAEEKNAKERIKLCNFEKYNEYYISPIRKRVPLPKDYPLEIKKYDEEELYNDNNHPENKLGKYWVMLSLTCHDKIENYPETQGHWSSLFVIFNVQNINLKSIEKYLCKYLSLKIWIRESETWMF